MTMTIVVIGDSAFDVLTVRERQVAKLLAVGSTSREIAAQLEINIKTVDTHRGHLLKKLGCRNNVELARRALRTGLVTLGAEQAGGL